MGAGSFGGAPLESFTQERALAVATKGQILLTFTNRIRLDFADTWVYHVKALKMTNYLVGATDAEVPSLDFYPALLTANRTARTARTSRTARAENLVQTLSRPTAPSSQALEGLRARKIPRFPMQTNLPTGEWAWGSPSFKALGPHKIELIYKSIQWGLEVLITDIDALVLRNPFPYVDRWPDAGFLTTTDHLHNSTTATDDGLELHNSIHTAFNIGYIFFRKSSLPLVEEWRWAYYMAII
tara:strand:+ start:789 stop:1511 length:723 start_codon:yes stop_codon:yes gene_type:complete